MAEYILLMHDDAISNDDAWGSYIQKLQQGGFFEGGSAIGDGVCARKSGEPASVTAHLTVNCHGRVRQRRARGTRSDVNIAADSFTPLVSILEPIPLSRNRHGRGLSRPSQL
jgi:hypothetical protein